MTMLKMILLMALAVFAAAAALVFAVDFSFYLRDRYCRFHIGRWADSGIWQAALEKQAAKWLEHTPTVKITDNSRYMLLDFAMGRYRSHSIQSWQKAALILAFLESGRPDLAVRAKKTASGLLDPQGNWRKPPVAVDCGMLSYAVLLACGPEACRPAMDNSITIIKNHMHKSGMISYTGSADNPEMYVDTLGLVCPFLMLYAKSYDCPEIARSAVFQLEMYHQYGILPGTSLPNHAFNVDSKLPLGVYGWGRGVGWYLIGLLDSLQNTKELGQRKLICSFLREAAEYYMPFQRPDGGFGSIVQRPDTYDSSATAVLAWFYLSCAAIFDESSYREIADRCFSKLRSVTRITGSIDWCQGDTKGIGIFSQTYSIMPFAQGMALRALYQREKTAQAISAIYTGESNGQ